MKRTVMKGTGRHLPERLVTNDDISKLMDTSDEWIRQRTGIEQRYWVPEDAEIGPSDLGAEAAKKALQKAGWTPKDIDLIIFASLSPDVFFSICSDLKLHLHWIYASNVPVFFMELQPRMRLSEADRPNVFFS